MKIVFYTLASVVLLHSIVFGMIKLHIIEYFTVFGLDIHFNNGPWKDILIYKYRTVILYISYLIIPIIIFLFYKEKLSKFLLSLVFVFSIFNIIISEPRASFDYIQEYIKYKIWTINHGMTTTTDNNEKKVFYESGKLKRITPLKNGTQKTFYESGKLESEINIVDGKKEGKEKKYYENTNLMSESIYKNGNIDGEVNSFYESSNKFGTFLYKNGIQVSYTLYYENGNIQEEKVVKASEDAPYGYEKNYYDNGKLRFHKIYNKDGKTESTTIFNIDGTIRNTFKRQHN